MLSYVLSIINFVIEDLEAIELFQLMMWKHRSSSQAAPGASPASLWLLLVVAVSFGCLVQVSHGQQEQGKGRK